MENVYNDRVKYKKLLLEAKQEFEDTGDPAILKRISRYDNIQMAKKISLNSAYGAIGNNYFRYFDILVATAITTAGQLSIRWIEKAINIYLNKILRLIKLITSLQAIQIRYISLLTFWLTRCLNREEQMRKLSISWTVLQKRSWNLLLAKVIKLLLRV